MQPVKVKATAKKQIGLELRPGWTYANGTGTPKRF